MEGAWKAAGTYAGRAPIAQLVELRAFNSQVIGSSPIGGTHKEAPTKVAGASLAFVGYAMPAAGVTPR